MSISTNTMSVAAMAILITTRIMSGAAAAVAGNPTDPEPVELRQGFLKPHYVQESGDARQRHGCLRKAWSRESPPHPAARAQTTFDCWLEQASEDLQSEHVESCEQAYLLAVAEVENALLPPPRAVDPDTDGDGVADSRDDCPGTPQRTPVDGRGRPAIPSLEGVHFEHDKAVLTASARSILDEVATITTANPHVHVEITGHRESSGSDSYKQSLSERRAQAARTYLESIGVSGTRLAALGRSESSPVADDSSREGRAANRRVDLTARPRN